MGLGFPHGLAICAIVRNEGRFIREWMEWHIMMGVSKFYLYDNDSDDDTAAVLRPFVEKGVVEYIFYPGKYRQIPAYNDCVVRHRYDCEWLAFIDGDEFLHPLGAESVLEFLRSMREGHENMGGLAVNWRLYGSNGHETSPGGVIDHYVRRGEDANERHKHIKSIVDPRRARCFLSAHYPVYYRKFYNVDERGNPVKFHLSAAGNQALGHICLAHYSMKSWEDWQKRKAMGKADTYGGYEVTREAFAADDAKLNAVFDDSMPRLKREIMDRNGGKWRLPRDAAHTLEDLERAAHELLENYAALDLEQALVLLHLSSRIPEYPARERIRSTLFFLLHLYLSRQQGIHISDYDMLWDEARRLPGACPDRELLMQDLEPMKPLIHQWKLTKSTNPYDFYIDRLIQSRQPDYRPRVALVTPSLQDVPEAVALREVARTLRKKGMDVVVYAASGGDLQRDFTDLGIPVLTEESLLERKLSAVAWYAGYDVVWLNTVQCYRLLGHHGSPVYRPIIWWLDSGCLRFTETEELKSVLSKGGSRMMTTVASSGEVRDFFVAMTEGWPIGGILPTPAAAGDEIFAARAGNLAEQVARIGISHRMPFEEGIQ